MPELQRTHGLLLIVSGPAGSGKTTVCERLQKAHEAQLNKVVTATTRPPRPGEVDGVDYHFLNTEAFEAKMGKGAFYEYAVVHKSHYGVLKDAVLGQLSAGVDLVLNVDVQGASTFRKAAEQDSLLKASLVSLFLMPPKLEVIRQRLEKRGADDPDEIKRRLDVAKGEIARWREYDYCLVSGTKDEDFRGVDAIYRAEVARVHRMGL